MKKLIALMACVLLVVPVLTGCGKSSAGENGQVYVYNWGEYISDGPEGRLNVI